MSKTSSQFVVQIIRQIGDLREALAFHDDKRADHGFFRKTLPSGRRSGQREIQIAEEFVVESSGALGCEQGYILNNFLSVDSGQPLSGWFSVHVNFTRKGLRFLQSWSDSRSQPCQESIDITAFFQFCLWLDLYKKGGFYENTDYGNWVCRSDRRNRFCGARE